MRLFVRDREFYNTLKVIAVSIALQNLITVAVSMMDTLMIGQLGEIQLSATSIANQLWFMLMILGFGIAGGANVLMSQYWGKGDVQIIRRIEAMTFKIGFVISIVFMAIALLLPAQFMSLFTTDAEVIEYGVQYLKILGWSYPLYSIANVSIMMLRSVGTVNISVIVYLSSLIVNTSLNYVLIFGKFGAPRLEVRGGAIATLVARGVEFIIIIGYVLLKEKKIKFSLKHLIPNNRSLYRKYVAISLPVVGNELMWGVGASMVAVVIGRMGTGFVAANSIYTVVNQFVTVAMFGVGNAAVTIIGNTIGAGEYEKAKERSVTLAVMSVALGVIAAGATLILGPIVISFYKFAPETIALAQSITHVGAVIVFFQSFAIIGMVGILRAGGDAKFVFVCEAGFMWAIAIPLGFVTGLVLGWPAPAVFLVLKCDEILKTVVSAFRICGFKWLRDITVRD